MHGLTTTLVLVTTATSLVRTPKLASWTKRLGVARSLSDNYRRGAAEQSWTHVQLDYARSHAFGGVICTVRNKYAGTHISMCERTSGREKTHELHHPTRSRTCAWNLDSSKLRQTWTRERSQNSRQLPDIRSLEASGEPIEEMRIWRKPGE